MSRRRLSSHGAAGERDRRPAFVEERTEYREIFYFHGRREARLVFEDGKLQRGDIHRVLDFEEDRAIFAGIFQYFYLRLAIFFGCLGIFMYLFRGEMSNRTLHFWFLAPARREVLLAGNRRRRLVGGSSAFAKAPADRRSFSGGWSDLAFLVE